MVTKGRLGKELQDLVLIPVIGVHLFVTLQVLVSLLQLHPDSRGTGKRRRSQQGTPFGLGYPRMGVVPENAEQTEIH